MSGLLFTAGFCGIASILIRGAASQTDWAPKYLKRHTPSLELQAPETLSGLARLKETPPVRFVLWLPGEEGRLRAVLLRGFPRVHCVPLVERRVGVLRF